MNKLLISAVESLKEDEVLMLVRQAIDDGVPAKEILDDIQVAMEKIGKHYENEEYFIADLMMGGIIFKEILGLDAFKLPTEEKMTAGTVLIGTVYGDMHDVGKDIFIGMLRAAGFNIIDLGVDVQHDDFVKTIERFKPNILALSGVMNFSVKSMRELIEILGEAGLRDKVKIIIGGSSLSEQSFKFTGADAYSDSPSKGVEICEAWIKEQSNGE